VAALLRVPGGAEVRGFGVRERLMALTVHARQGPGITRDIQTGKKTPGGAGTHTGHGTNTGHTDSRTTPVRVIVVSVSKTPEGAGSNTGKVTREDMWRCVSRRKHK
jgi:hypothetical protein